VGILVTVWSLMWNPEDGSCRVSQYVAKVTIHDMAEHLKLILHSTSLLVLDDMIFLLFGIRRSHRGYPMLVFSDLKTVNLQLVSSPTAFDIAHCFSRFQ
jgi:hypothetical protein